MLILIYELSFYCKLYAENAKLNSVSVNFIHFFNKTKIFFYIHRIEFIIKQHLLRNLAHKLHK